MYFAPTPSLPPPTPLQILMLAVALGLGVMAYGQTPASPTMPSPTTQTPTTQPANGWTFFDDRVGSELNLSAEELDRLRAVDDQYRREYNGLGTDPITSPQYRELTDRRNGEIQRIMSPQHYADWNLKYNVPNTIQDDIMQAPQRTGTPPPPPTPQQP